MSRHVEHKEKLEIAYGYDRMTPEGGYFFQVFDKTKRWEVYKSEEENKEAEKLDPSGSGMIINEGFIKSISKNRILELMQKYDISNKEHVKNVALDLQI